MRRLEVALAAELDLAAIFDHSTENFGPRARQRYEDLVEAALVDLLADPLRLGSLDRPELAANVRTYHLRHSRPHRKAKGATVSNPRHLIAYEFDESHVLVLRVLHDAIDLASRLDEADPEIRPGTGTSDT